MNLPRVALGIILTAGSVVLACSDNDTIVALNVTSDRAYVGEARLLRAVFTQEGQAPVSEEWEPPNSDVESGRQIAQDVDRRITLPDGWGELETTVIVTAISPSDSQIASEPTKFRLHPNETTAAFVNLNPPVEPEPPAAGGAGGNGGEGGNGGTDGSSGDGAGGAAAGAGGTAAGAAGTEAGQAGGTVAGNGGTAS